MLFSMPFAHRFTVLLFLLLLPASLWSSTIKEQLEERSKQHRANNERTGKRGTGANKKGEPATTWSAKWRNFSAKKWFWRSKKKPKKQSNIHGIQPFPNAWGSRPTTSHSSSASSYNWRLLGEQVLFSVGVSLLVTLIFYLIVSAYEIIKRNVEKVMRYLRRRSQKKKPHKKPRRSRKASRQESTPS